MVERCKGLIIIISKSNVPTKYTYNVCVFGETSHSQREDSINNPTINPRPFTPRLRDPGAGFR